MRRPSGLILALIAGLALAGCNKAAAPTSDAGKAFLASNAHAAGVHVTASGLQYKILASGPASGVSPRPDDEVKVNYEGKLLNGQVFDSSYQRGEPAVMTVRDLVPGWIEALQTMRPGDVWMVYLPPALGYGDHEAGPIPAGSVLVFKLELLGVSPALGPAGANG